MMLLRKTEGILYHLLVNTCKYQTGLMPVKVISIIAIVVWVEVWN